MLYNCKQGYILEGNTILIKVDAAAKIIENHDKEFVSVKGNKKAS